MTLYSRAPRRPRASPFVSPSDGPHESARPPAPRRPERRRCRAGGGVGQAGFDGAGRLLAVDVDLVCNGDSTICCSNMVMDRGLSHFQSAYDLQALRAVGRIAY